MYELNTTNAKLANHIKAIKKLDETTKKSVFETAVRLNIIDTEGWAKDEGFKNTAELAAECFGYSRSTTLNYIKIASRYLEVDTTNNGKKMVVSTICARRDDNGNVTSDYNIGQLNAIGKLSQADFIKLDNEDVIDPSMTQKEIKNAIKNWEKQFLDESDIDDLQEGQDENEEPIEGDPELDGGEDFIATLCNDVKELREKLDNIIDVCETAYEHTTARTQQKLYVMLEMLRNALAEYPDELTAEEVLMESNREKTYSNIA